MTGCAIGEVAGMVLGSAFGWANGASMALAIGLAYLFGFALTAWPLVRAGLPRATVVSTALASDTASITTMEFVDNLFIALVPGAIAAGLGDVLFWASIAGGFALAFPFAFAVNRYLIGRGRGHAVMHAYHDH